MTNGERVRNMSDEELAYFINLGRPSCNEICEDAKCGCSFGCRHKQGEEIILEWLKANV